MEFKSSIGKQEFNYNHFTYRLEVDVVHAVWWMVLKPGTETLPRVDYLVRDLRIGREVDEDPKGAIEWAHASARAWIDNYVTTHLLLQEATEEANQLFENERVEVR